MTRAELLKAVGRRELRRRPTFGPADRPKREDPLPRRGWSWRITGPGPKLSLNFLADGVEYARWDDERDEIQVSFITYEEWNKKKGAAP